MVRPTISRALVGFALFQSVAQSVDIYVTNKCQESMTLAHVTPGGVSTDTLNAGDSITKLLAVGTSSHVFKSGLGAQATLAEFSTMGGKTWVDISIIPTGPKSGPEYCANLQACKDLTGGVGFNVAMQITPHVPDGGRCVQLTCMSDGCDDAYLFPKDDTKTHTCPLSTDFDLVFCPGGSGASPSVTQSPPTPSPTPSPKPESTPSPDPVPTTAPTYTPTATPSPKETESPSTTGSNGLNDPEQQDIAESSDSADLAGSTSLEQQSVVQSALEEAEADEKNLRKGHTKGVQTYTNQQTTQTNKEETKHIGGQPNEEYDVVQQVSTRSETSNGNSMPLVILAIGGFVGLVAAATIVVVRKKKAQLEELESKTPLSTTAHGTLANFRTPRNNVSVL